MIESNEPGETSARSDVITCDTDDPATPTAWLGDVTVERGGQVVVPAFAIDRTEAVLKATGHGLDVDPRLVGISGPDAAPRLETWHGPGRRPAVTLTDLDLGGGFVGCVARLGRGRAGVDGAVVALRDQDVARAFGVPRRPRHHRRARGPEHRTDPHRVRP